MKASVSFIPNNPWPDHIAFLKAKLEEIVSWAEQELGERQASQVRQFLKTQQFKAIASLTDLERKKLLTKFREANKKVAEKLAKSMGGR
jgi:uncharacterized alpha-E superfamily protein